ncbi:MAG: hypothetical protein IT364_22960 [Candidatus Hydrogenedentes bacterium]|nr:hypothetical protein [Candidatus Hydrogenedentota bacterium]
MRRITIQLSEEDAIELEAAAKYLHLGHTAQDAIYRAVNDTISRFRAEQRLHAGMERAEEDLERVMYAFIRDGMTEEYLSGR